MGSRGKFSGPGSQEGPAKTLIQTVELNDILVGLKPLSCPCAATPAQWPVLFIAPGPELTLDGHRATFAWSVSNDIG